MPYLIPRNFSKRNFRDFTPEIAVRFLGANRGKPGITGFSPWGSMNNKFIKIFVIILAILIGLGIVKDQIIKAAVQVGASQVLGTDVRVGGFSFGILRQSVRVKAFQIDNPKGFPKGSMLDVTQVGVDYDLPALLTGKLHFPLVILDLNEMVVVKNQDGVLNVDALKVAEKKEAAPAGKPAQPLSLKIDELRLNVNKVVYKDYTQGKEPLIQVFDVNLKNKTYQDIQSAQQLAALIMAEAMKSTAIKGAKIYGVATILGAGFLPAGIAGTLLGKDSAQAEFGVSFDRSYQAALEVIKGNGVVTDENKTAGVIKAEVSGHNVTVKVMKLEQGKTEIVITVRKFLIPQPEVAQGILYQIQEKLNK